MTTKDKSLFSNALQAQEAQNNAIQAARRVLELKGITYPYYDSKLTPEQNYERMLSYAEQESALVVTYLKMPSGPRPLELDNVKPVKREMPTRWSGYCDD